ncbi:MAG: hypothetical protein ACOC0D_06220 [Spirochaeta sp.]
MKYEQRTSNKGCITAWGTFSIGFVSVWPALLVGVWLQEWLPLQPGSPAAPLLYAALPEEVIKFIVAAIMMMIFRVPAMLVGLGFGLSETVFLASASPWPIRLLTSVPLHAGTTAIAAFLVRHTPLPNASAGIGRLAGTIGLLGSAVLLHWIYNLAVRQSSILYWFAAWLPLLLWAALNGLRPDRNTAIKHPRL